MYLMGDLHGEIEELLNLIKGINEKTNSEIIVLGDAGVNYFQDSRDQILKQRIQNEINSKNEEINVLFVRGNHDCRPEKIQGYKIVKKYGGECYIEEAYPNLLFLKDGEKYEIQNKNYIVLGGGFSSDFFNRILNGYGIWIDQELSKEEYLLADKNMHGLQEFSILSHMLPIDVVKSLNINVEYISETEKNFNNIMIKNSEKICNWYSGHYHRDVETNQNSINFKIIYKKVIEI